MTYVTDLNNDELDLMVFQIVNLDDPEKVLDSILINKIDEIEVFNLLRACDTSNEVNNKYYDCIYHGFFEYMKERRLWYIKVASRSYMW